MCLRDKTYLKNCKQTAEKLLPLNHIEDLPTQGQICSVSELQLFTFVIFEMKYPVPYKS